MAQANYPACEKRIIDSEGSKYTDGVHPYDPGGPTRWGITLTDARLYWKKAATADDVRLMPITVALAIYKTKYWDKLACDALPSGLDYTVVDYGVNSGIGRSGKVLRRLCGLSDHTSLVNQEVLDAVAKRDVNVLIEAMNKERLAFLKTLKIWPTYKNGWTTRVNGVNSFSHQLANAPAATVAAAPVITAAASVHIMPEDKDMAKGQVEPQTAAKNTIKAGVPVATTATGYAWLDWVTAHPGATAIIVVCVGVIVAVAWKALNDAHKAKQEAPLPNWEVIPELKG